MAKRKSSPRHGHSGDPRKRAEEQARAQAEAAPALEEEVATALESGHPIDIVMLASALIAGLDPDLRAPEEDLPTPGGFVRMFLESHDQRLHALAWTVSRLLPDTALRDEVDGVLTPGTVPDWLAPLDRPEVVEAWRTTDPLRDSTDVVISVRVGDADLTVIALIDFNADGAVKDGFVVPAPLTAVQEALSASGETGMEAWEIEPADAAAWLTDGIRVGRETDPPFESDSWPQARPLLEWTTRLCPPGGRAWERPHWGRDEIEALVAEFAASPAGGQLTDPADRDVLVDALHTLAEETSGDPQLLSAVRLEIGLGYLWSTRLHQELEQLLTLPELLGPYLRWAHARRGVPADDTDEALAAIAHYRAAYVRDVVEVNADPDADPDSGA
jgi:hypothetical protein